MGEQEFFGRGSDQDPEKGKDQERAREYAEHVGRLFSETFGTPSGKLCLGEMRKHLVGGVLLNRVPETETQVIRRDALRDVLWWVEGMVKQGNSEREVIF